VVILLRRIVIVRKTKTEGTIAITIATDSFKIKTLTTVTIQINH